MVGWNMAGKRLTLDGLGGDALGWEGCAGLRLAGDELRTPELSEATLHLAGA